MSGSVFFSQICIRLEVEWSPVCGILFANVKVFGTVNKFPIEGEGEGKCTAKVKMKVIEGTARVQR